MFKIAATIALMISTPALAAPDVWVDPTCQVTIEIDKGIFTIAKTDDSFETKCVIKAWPSNMPDATLACDTGATTTVRTLDTTLIFDGAVMYKAGSPEVLCD